MGASNKSLIELFNGVREGIITKLETDPGLTEVEEVVYGERQRIGRLKSPAVWMVPEPYTPQLRGGRTAQHDFTFNFVVLVKGNSPQEDLKQAETLSMTIYDVFTADRTLGGLVDDARPLRVDPAYEAGNNTQLYWSSVQFAFRLQRRE